MPFVFKCFPSASRQVSSGMQIFSDCWEGKPTRLVSDYCCFSSAQPGCSANRYSNKHAHHARSPPTVGQQNKQPQPCTSDYCLSCEPPSGLFLFSSSDLRGELQILVAEGTPFPLWCCSQIHGPGIARFGNATCLLGQSHSAKIPKDLYFCKGLKRLSVWFPLPILWKKQKQRNLALIG